MHLCSTNSLGERIMLKVHNVMNIFRHGLTRSEAEVPLLASPTEVIVTEYVK